jgi:ferredoxin-NADP reductase
VTERRFHGLGYRRPPVRDHDFHPLRVRRVVRETADAASFVLDVPDELRDAYAYEPGQFLTFRAVVGGERLLRCYSMCSAPAAGDDLTVTVKRVPGGAVSNWFNDALCEGDTVEATVPAGVFRLAPDGDVVAFAGGSGITPIMSIVKTALVTTDRRVRLLYANRDAESIIFAAELDRLAADHGARLEVLHHLDVERGFVDDDAVRAFVGATVQGAGYYVCGPGPFMDIVERTLLALGVDPAHVQIERFSPVEPPPAVAQEESADAITVTVELDGKTASTEHRAGTTVLQTARQMGMSPPFSCESGSCATCMAKLVDGAVKMYVNNALTDDEVAEGWILTCQSVPTSPAVHVVYE